MVERLGHRGAKIAVDQEADGHGGQDPAHGTARGLQDQGDQRRAQHQIVGGWPGGARLDLFRVDRQMDGAVDRHEHQQPVEQARAAQGAAHGDQWVAGESKADGDGEARGKGVTLEDAAFHDHEGDPANTEDAGQQFLNGDHPVLCFGATTHQRIKQEDQRQRERQEA